MLLWASLASRAPFVLWNGDYAVNGWVHAMVVGHPSTLMIRMHKSALVHLKLNTPGFPVDHPLVFQTGFFKGVFACCVPGALLLCQVSRLWPRFPLPYSSPSPSAAPKADQNVTRGMCWYMQVCGSTHSSQKFSLHSAQGVVVCFWQHNVKTSTSPVPLSFLA